MTDLQPGQVIIRDKKGRESVYDTVPYRIKKFWAEYPDFAINTRLIHCDENIVRFKAEIYDEAKRKVATGHAEENRKYGYINPTSAIENCETSAIGRALACLGIGGTEFRSAEEMQRAMLQQEEMDVKLKREVIAQTLTFLENNDSLGLRQLWDEELTHDQQMICWREFNSKQKAKIRELSQEGARILAEQSTGDENAPSTNVENV